MRSSISAQHCAPSTFGIRGLVANTGNRLQRELIRKGIHPYGAGRGGPMELQCPNCRSTDLKKVSLVYQEGLRRVRTRMRLRGMVVGSDGPDLVVGRATTEGIQQTDISKMLTPPKKWSYRRLFGWSLLAFLSVGWIVFYVNTITTNSSTLSSLPLAMYIVFSASVCVCLLVAWSKHNYSTYRRQRAQWDRSFICKRCGAISEQEL